MVFHLGALDNYEQSRSPKPRQYDEIYPLGKELAARANIANSAAFPKIFFKRKKSIVLANSDGKTIGNTYLTQNEKGEQFNWTLSKPDRFFWKVTRW
jgi:hypothetical protein